MKRRVMCLILCLLILVGMAMPVGASAAMKDRVVKIMKVNVQGARLREGPSSKYDVITSLGKGSCVFYLEKEKAAFSYVRSSQGKIGYVYEGFLSEYGACKLSQVYTAIAASKLCDRPSEVSNRVTTIHKNEHVILYKTRGNWAYVKTLQGKGGFVKLNRFKKTVKTK
ncbi:MAG: SH3 domain-containing protein [Clostridia bacterium]|nr:SH3 domain-containing protein [Clostridia bacterium]